MWDNRTYTRARGVLIVFGITLRHARRGLLGALGILGLASVASPVFANGPQKAAPPTKSAKVSQEGLAERLRDSAASFKENKGQWDTRAKFLAQTRNMNVWVTADGLVFDHFKVSGTGDAQVRSGTVVGMRFEGAGDGAKVVGRDQTRLLSDYMTSPGNGVKGVHSFREVVQTSITQGVDVRSYIEKGQPRYDVIIGAGVDPSTVRMAFQGVDSLAVNESAELVVSAGGASITQKGLIAYQIVNGKRSPVVVRFDAADDNTVGFALGAYDTSKPVVIDPLVYGSYYGGEDGFDEVRAVVADQDGGVYVTGGTQASRFPAIFGPYSFTLRGTMDAFVSKFQGDAYTHDYSAFLGGSIAEYGQFIDIDPHGDVWAAGYTQSSDFPTNTRPNIQYLSFIPDRYALLNGNGPPTGGTFTLRYNNNPLQTTAPIPYNAGPTQVQNALNAVPGLFGIVVQGAFNLPEGELKIILPNSLPGLLTVNSSGLAAIYDVIQRPLNQGQQLRAGATAPSAGTFTLTFLGDTTGPLNWDTSPLAVQNALGALPSIGAGNVAVVPATTGQNATQAPYIIILNTNNPQPLITVDNSALTGQYGVDGLSRQEVIVPQSVPTSGTFVIGWQGAFSPNLPFAISAAALQTALQALPNIGAANMRCIDGGPGFNQAAGPLPSRSIVCTFMGTLVETPPNLFPPLEIFSNFMPRPVYAIYKPGDQFLIRFKKSLTTVLDPLPSMATILGGERDEPLAGMKVIPNDDPLPSDPVSIVVVGNTTRTNPLPELGGSVPMVTDGYVIRYSFDGSTFTKTNAQYVSGNGSRNTIGGLAVDRSGQAFVAGTAFYGSQVDTAVFAAFMTTGSVFPGGRLLRKNDAFVRKYGSNGGILYSALIGGNGNDAGNGVAIDGAGNAYIAGISGSFNFPRTPGVYGENFSATPVVFTTKINLDASQIVYSTHLRTTPPVSVSGVAVDNAGNAYVAGVTDYTLSFNPPAVFAVGETIGTVPTTENGLRLIHTFPLQPEIPSDDGFLLVLNANASNLLYGTYVGDILDEYVWAPYTDRLGDVWVFGYSDSFRQYFLGGQLFSRSAQLADAFLSPFAFKRTGDQQGNTGLETLYGPRDPNWNIFYAAPYSITPTYRRDGFLIKLRLGLPTIANLTITPNAVAGGLGASATGTLTLTLPAPAGGLDIVLNLDNAAASFSPSGFQDTMVLSFPGGQSVATFTIYTNVVTQPTNVNVRATLEGNFMNRVLTVQPWLSQLTLSPNTIVGGNQVTGRVRIFQTAITDVTVDVSTDNASLIGFPAGATVTVPAGQDTATFLIDTEGVGNQTVANVTASLLGVGKTQPITVNPANLVNVTFNPTRVTGGTASTGTVTLDGKTGTAFTVNLTIDAGTAGYQIIPTTITFNPGDRSKDFVVQTVYEPIDTQRKITATRPPQGGYSGQSRIGTLFIDRSDLLAFTIDKASVNVGENATGTVSLSKAAGTGGAVVDLSASNALVTVPATVVIPAGSTSGSFTITTTTGAVLGDQTVDITASRGPVSITRTLTVISSSLGFTISPSSVVGGDSATGTVSLGAPANGDVTVNLSSNNGAATVPSTVTIVNGSSSATFTINTIVVASTVDADITATVGTLTATRTLQVRAVGVAGISFTPPKVRGGQTSICRVTLDSPAPAGGVVVSLTNSNPLVATIPSFVTIPAGASFLDFTVQTRRVSRTLATFVTATRNTTSETAILTATR